MTIFATRAAPLLALATSLAASPAHADEAADATIAVRLAEQHQIDEWGEVEAGHDLDAAHVALSLSAGAGFFRLSRGPR